MKRTKLHIKQHRRKQKKNVAIGSAYDHLYVYMDTTEGQKKVSGVAKERENNSKDINLSVKGD